MSEGRRSFGKQQKREHLEVYKFLRALRKHDRIFPIEGHCPALLGLDLAKFLFLGINADHTEHSLEELRQRFAGGMFVEIQGKMLKKEVLDFIAENNLFERFCFVTDDVMADTLRTEGHLDALVRGAIRLGLTPEQAIYNATFTP
jgi:Adenine deaminase